MSENTSPNEPRLHRAGGDERDMVTKCAKCCVLPFWLAGSQTLVTRDPEWEGYERMVYETRNHPKSLTRANRDSCGPTEGPKVIQAIYIIHIKRLRRVLLGESEA